MLIRQGVVKRDMIDVENPMRQMAATSNQLFLSFLQLLSDLWNITQGS